MRGSVRKRTIEVSDSDVAHIVWALIVHKNYIETGKVWMSADDSIQQKQLPKSLDDGQKAKIAAMNDLLDRLQKE